MEDVRLCRFPTTDSRQTEYPWQSPYAYYMNSPISIIDFNGEGNDENTTGKWEGTDPKDGKFDGKEAPPQMLDEVTIYATQNQSFGKADDFKGWYDSKGGDGGYSNFIEKLFNNKISDAKSSGYAKLFYGTDADGNANLWQSPDAFRNDAENEAWGMYKDQYATEKSGVDPNGANYGLNPFARAYWMYYRSLATTSTEEGKQIVTNVAIDVGIQQVIGLSSINFLRTPFTITSRLPKLNTFNDIFKNPNVLLGKTFNEVEPILKNQAGWEYGTMNKSSQGKIGFTMRQLNSRGTDFTDHYLQYHPGTSRHFGGRPYWKVSNGNFQGGYRVPAFWH